jgi:CheY-like chemotaxis protein
MMNVLIVEDEGPKRDHVSTMVLNRWPDATIGVAKSVRSAIAAVRKAPPSLILLDMSLPTFDVEPGEPGGRPQGFGGIEVLRYLERYGIAVPVIVVTAYEAFSIDGKEIGLEGLAKVLGDEHKELFRGLVYFNSVFGDWRQKLEQYITDVQAGAQKK